MVITKNIQLCRYTTFNLGGLAKFFSHIKNEKDLIEAADFAKKNKLKIFILGGGSNVLVSDKGFDGLVLKVDIKGINFNGDTVTAGAGEVWDKVVAKAVDRGLWGIENLSLIPGSVGGAVYQNIGAYGVELKDVIKSVKIFDIKSGKIKNFSPKMCRFGYRNSFFQNKDYVIFEVVLKLSKKLKPNLAYPDLQKYFGLCLYHDRDTNTMLKKYDKNGDKGIKVGNIRRAVIKIRKSKLNYPTKDIGTAGSFFKNPTVTIKQLNNLTIKQPNIKGRKTKSGHIKLSAGQLIELAGWKGKMLGTAGVSPKHALVLLSYGKAKSADITKLAQKIQQSVYKKFGIKLEREVKII